MNSVDRKTGTDATERLVSAVHGDRNESAVGGEHAVGDQAVDVRMEVHE
jgi:hypothetical protein